MSKANISSGRYSHVSAVIDCVTPSVGLLKK